MNEPEKEPLGVSGFLPAMAADILVRAARTAQDIDPYYLERVRVIDDAIDEVRRRWPEYFVRSCRASSATSFDGICSGQQKGNPDR